MVKLCADFDPNKILQTYYSLGLGRYMNEIFISTREGYLPEYKNLSLREKVSLCYGYGLQTTLVQLTSAYSTIFSEGVYRPLKLIKNSSHFEEERILSKENAISIKNILFNAIKNGTGFRATVNDHDVFGKTGTARIFKDQKYNEDLHNALFIGMTKIEDKEYLVGLFVKNPRLTVMEEAMLLLQYFRRSLKPFKNFNNAFLNRKSFKLESIKITGFTDNSNFVERDYAFISFQKIQRKHLNIPKMLLIKAPKLSLVR